MKTFEANEELIDILLKQGFIETTSKREKFWGKKSFKLSKTSSKQICFDHITIRVYKAFNVNDGRNEITEPELKVIILYFKLPTKDYKEIDRYQNVNFGSVLMEISRLRKEFKSTGVSKISQLRKDKIERILSAFDKIDFE